MADGSCETSFSSHGRKVLRPLPVSALPHEAEEGVGDFTTKQYKPLFSKTTHTSELAVGHHEGGPGVAEIGQCPPLLGVTVVLMNTSRALIITVDCGTICCYRSSVYCLWCFRTVPPDQLPECRLLLWGIWRRPCGWSLP